MVSELHQQARRSALLITSRVMDPHRASEALHRLPRQTDFPVASQWVPYSVAQGDAGLALLATAVATHDPSRRARTMAHDRLQTAVHGLVQTAVPRVGLWEGVCGVLVTCDLMSQEGRHYPRLLEQLRPVGFEAISSAVARIHSTSPLQPPDYDLINGLVGLGSGLLSMTPSVTVNLLLERVSSILCDIADQHDRAPFPTARSCPEDVEGSVAQEYVDAGVAHGIAGMLAMLALAHTSGRQVDERVPGTIHRCCAWLEQVRSTDLSGGWVWPRVVVMPIGGAGRPTGPTRHGWCYGDFGVARALWLAGRALADPGTTAASIEGLRRAISLFKVEDMQSPGLCHGLAGVLQIVSHFTWDLGEPWLKSFRTALAEALVARCDTRTLLGVQDTETGGRVVDSPGFLSGAAGVAAALHSFGWDEPPPWARLLLLS